MASLSSGTVTVGGSNLDAYSVQISASGGGAGDDTIDVTTLSDTQIQTFERPLKAAGAAGARYSVTIEYFGNTVATSSSASVTLPVLGTASNATVSSSAVTYAVNDVVRSSATILIP
jgi:hypothetical protein